MNILALLDRINVLSSANTHVHFIGLTSNEPSTGDIDQGETGGTPIDPDPIERVNRALIRADETESKTLALELFALWRRYCIGEDKIHAAEALFGKNLVFSHDGKVYFKIEAPLSDGGEYTAVVWYHPKDGETGWRVAYLMTIRGSLEVIEGYLEGMRAIQELTNES
jgi:hypothetical protein